MIRITAKKGKIAVKAKGTREEILAQSAGIVEAMLSAAFETGDKTGAGAMAAVIMDMVEEKMKRELSAEDFEIWEKVRKIKKAVVKPPVGSDAEDA